MRVRGTNEDSIADALLVDVVDKFAATADEGIVLDAGAGVMIEICSHDGMNKRAGRFMEAARAAP